MAKKLLLGNEAFACAALEAGVGVVAGYPGTPSSELIATVAARVADGSAQGVHVEWSTNEKAALELLAGASYAGARTLFTCKQVGLNVASDALMSLVYVGVEGGCVLYVADDPGPISSQTEQDTRRFASFAKVPVFDPADIEQGMEMMRAAFDLSERYRTPVIVRGTTRVCHSSTFVEVKDVTQARGVKGFKKDDRRWVIFPARAYRGHLEANERLKWIEAEFSGSHREAAGDGVVRGRCVGVNPATDLDAARLLPEVAADLGMWASDGSRKAEECKGVAAKPPCDLSRFNPCISSPAVAEGKDPARTSRASRTASATSGPGVLGIVCGGVSTAYVREALSLIAEEQVAEAQQAAGEGTRRPLPYLLLQVGTPFPFPVALAHEVMGRVSRIIVFEELDHVIEDELLRIAGLRAIEGLPVPPIAGRASGERPGAGENTVESIAEQLRREFDRSELEAQGLAGERLAAALAERCAARQCTQASPVATAIKLPARPPVLCAGCPHRGAFYAAKQAIRRMRTRAVFNGDIGCYTLGNAQPLDAVDTCLCMGAGITMAQGLAVAEPGVKQLAFIGDSTLFASGLTGIVNAAYNAHNITVCVLDNATTAMTGGQPHPGIGTTLMGTTSAPPSIEKVLEALGVASIEVVDPNNLEEGIGAVSRAVDFEGLSAVVFREPCVTLVRPDAALWIDVQACTGCKRCITTIGCPAIGFDAFDQGEDEPAGAAGAKVGMCQETRPAGRRRLGVAVIDATLCTGCGLCPQVCPHDCIMLPGTEAYGGAVGSPIPGVAKEGAR